MQQVIFFIENKQRPLQSQSGICNVLGTNAIFCNEFLYDTGIEKSKWTSETKCILLKQDDVKVCTKTYPSDITGWDVVLIDDDSAIRDIPYNWNKQDEIGVIHHRYPENINDFSYTNKKKGEHIQRDISYGALRTLLLSYKDDVQKGFNNEKYKTAFKAILDLFSEKRETVLNFLHGCLVEKPKDFEKLEAAGIDTKKLPVLKGNPHEDVYMTSLKEFCKNEQIEPFLK